MQNNKSGNLSGLIAILGLVALVAGLVIMLLLPGMKLSAWGIMGVGVVLLVIALVINFRRFKGAITGRRGRFGLGTSIMAVIFIGIIIFINAISIDNYHRFDTSSLSQFTLTPQTIEALENLEEPVKMTGFFVPESKDTLGMIAYLKSLLSVYESYNTKQITVQYVDPDEHPDQALQYGITQYQTVVFESGDQYRLVPPTEFLGYDSQGNLGIQAEHAFTSAILEVTGVAQKKVYFLTGHSEASIDSNFSKAAEGLRDDLYLVGTLNLMTNPSIPDDCAVLIIAAPQSAMTEGELAIINAYLDGGGQALILTNPGSPPDIDEIVSRWGVNIGEGTIVDPGSCVSAEVDIPLVPEDRDYFLLTSVYFPGAATIIPQESTPANISMYPLVYTSASSWLDKNFTAGEKPVFDSETETMEPLAIGVLIAGVISDSATKYTRLAVIGDSDFASNEHFDSVNNGDLFLNTVSWLAEETSLISIRRIAQPFRRLVITEGQEGFIKYSSATLLPLLVLVAGGIIWWRRR